MITDNQIGNKGGNTISEFLKTNTSLNDLNVGCLEEFENKKSGNERPDTWKWKWTDCGIGREGKKSLRIAWGERKGKLVI